MKTIRSGLTNLTSIMKIVPTWRTDLCRWIFTSSSILFQRTRKRFSHQHFLEGELSIDSSQRYANIWRIMTKTLVLCSRTSTTSRESFEESLKHLTRNKSRKEWFSIYFNESLQRTMQSDFRNMSILSSETMSHSWQCFDEILRTI